MTALRYYRIFRIIDFIISTLQGSFRRTLVGSFLCTIMASSIVEAQPLESLLRSYNYSDEGLLIRFRTEVNTTIGFQWNAFNADGQPQGSTQSLKLAVVGDVAAIPVTNAPAHFVRFRLGTRNYQILANRGVQFPGDNATGIRYSDLAYDLESDLAPNEMLLASAFRGYARTPVTPQSFEIGRTLGIDEGKGVSVKPSHALVISAKGTVEAVIVTLTQQVSVVHNEYWEYPLVINPDLRRFVIPLSYFKPRETNQASLSSIYAVSFRTVSPARARDELTVDMLALTEEFVTLKSAKRTGKGVLVSINGKYRSKNIRLMLGDDQGNIRVVELNGQRSVRIPQTEETRYFLCYGLDPSSQVCDPPDAPHTSYRLPRPKGSSVSIDLFEEGLPLNAYRELTTIYMSGMDEGNAYKAKRGNRRLELLFYPNTPGVEVDYAGYSTPIPDDLPPDLLSVQLNVCKATASQTTMIGLKDVHNNEPKIALGDYMDGFATECKDVAIPMEAFRSALPIQPNKESKLNRLKAVTVTMEQGDERDKHELVLRQIALTPTRTPLKVASFDRLYDKEPRWRTSFGRSVWTETKGSAFMSLSDSAGKVGRSLKVEIHDVGNTSYGLLAIVLGQTDVSPYQKIAFWVRGLKGGESATLYLNDGDNRKPVRLKDLVSITTEWTRVEIPLDLFRKDIRLNKLKSILIAWEDEVISQQTVYLDDFIFE